MTRIVYKLHFSSAVRIGENRLSNTLEIMHSDTLFSALAIAWMHCHGTMEDFVHAAQHGDLRISSAMPYHGSTLYIKKPLFCMPFHASHTDGKSLKKISYIPLDGVPCYVDFLTNGGALPFVIPTFSQMHMVQKVNLQTEQSEPYLVAVRSFHPQCGLYFIADFTSLALQQQFESALDCLADTGIGGKISAGYGNFTYEKEDFPSLPSCAQPNCHIALSLISPSAQSLTHLHFDKLGYQLISRGGFVNSANYRTDATPVKRKRVAMFAEGSCFNHATTGQILDVSGPSTNHPVYRYGCGMYLGVSL